MTRPRLTIAVALLALAAICCGEACAKPVIVYRAVETPPSDYPILVQPDEAEFVAASGSYSHTPTVTQGSGLTFDIVSGTLPSGLSEGTHFNTSTGELTGTVSSSAASGTYLVRATTADFTAVTETPNEFYDIWVRWHIYTSTGTVGNGDGSPQYLSTAGRLYDVTADIYANGTALALTAANIAVRGNGYKVYYDQATPIALADAGFEEVDDWDFTNAANADRYAGSYIGQTLFEGSYSLRFDTPTANNQYVESDGTVVLPPNTPYAFSGMAYMGDTDPGVTPYIDLVGTGAETTVRAEKTGNSSQANYFFVAQFVTGSGTPTYKVRVGIEGGSTMTGRDIYFDSIRITRDRPTGVVVGPQNWDAGTPDDVTSFGASSGSTLSGLGIEAGAEKGWRGHAVMTVNSTNVCAIGCDMAINGASASCWHLQDTAVTGAQYYLANNLSSTNTISSSRGNGHGALLYLFSGTVAHNTMAISPISGVYAAPGTVMAPVTHTIAYNTAQSQGGYSNNFAYVVNGSNSSAYKNVLNNAEAPYQSRGMILNPTATVFANTLTSQDLGSSQEYGPSTGGVSLGGAYVHQQEYTNGSTIAYQTVKLVGVGGGGCFRVGPDNNVDSTGLTVYDHCTAIVDVDDNPESGTNQTQAACVKIYNMNLDRFEFRNCSFTTNVTLIEFAHTQGYTPGALEGELLVDDCSIRYIDEGMNDDYCWTSYVAETGWAEINCRLRDPVYYDEGTRAWVDQPPDSGIGEDTTDVYVIEENTCTVTFTDGGIPVANTAIVVTDETATEVFNDTTDANGRITFIAGNWQRENGVRTDLQTHTFSVTGYQDATADLTNTNKTPTVALTAE